MLRHVALACFDRLAGALHADVNVFSCQYNDSYSTQNPNNPSFQPYDQIPSVSSGDTGGTRGSMSGHGGGGGSSTAMPSGGGGGGSSVSFLQGAIADLVRRCDYFEQY